MRRRVGIALYGLLVACGPPCADPRPGELAGGGPPGEGHELELCWGGRDDDGDGAVDCADADCVFDDACWHGDDACPDPCGCPWTEACADEDCDDGYDGDRDGQADCRDLSCRGSPSCYVELCDDNRDGDGDGLVDCDDPDCAPTDVTGGLPPGPDLPLEEFPDALAQAYCDRLFACARHSAGGPDRGWLAPSIFGTEERCARELAPRIVGLVFGRVTERAAAGGVGSYDAGAARRCVDRLGADCVLGNERSWLWQLGLDGELPVADLLCRDVFRAAVPARGPCTRTVECGGGSACRLAAGTCSGTCLPLTVRRVHAGCWPTAWIGLAPPAGTGESCDALGSRDHRTWFAPCVEGHACLGTCVRLPEAGEPCTWRDPRDTRCAQGLVCGPGAVCEPFRTELQAGGPCGSDPSLPACDALRRLVCDGQACVPLQGDGGEGSECLTSFAGQLSCDPGFECDPDDGRPAGIGRCSPEGRAAGEPCVDDGDCESLFCDRTSFTCQPGCVPP